MPPEQAVTGDMLNVTGPSLEGVITARENCILDSHSLPQSLCSVEKLSRLPRKPCLSPSLGTLRHNTEKQKFICDVCRQ
jgi:hypothetical protein